MRATCPGRPLMQPTAAPSPMAGSLSWEEFEASLERGVRVEELLPPEGELHRDWELVAQLMRTALEARALSQDEEARLFAEVDRLDPDAQADILLANDSTWKVYGEGKELGGVAGRWFSGMRPIATTRGRCRS